MWRELVLVEDPVASAAVAERDPVYLKFLSDMGLPAPHPKPAGKPYVAKIHGLSAQYGLDRQFLSYSKNHLEDGTRYTYNLDPGFYEIQKHKGDVPARGFVRVDEKGKMTPATLRDILVALAPNRPELLSQQST